MQRERGGVTHVFKTGDGNSVHEGKTLEVGKVGGASEIEGDGLNKIDNRLTNLEQAQGGRRIGQSRIGEATMLDFGE